MPAIALSDAALALLRLHLERHGQIDVDDTNREIYRELARAGIMVAAHSFTGGDESIYRLTKEGFERRLLVSVLLFAEDTNNLTRPSRAPHRAAGALAARAVAGRRGVVTNSLGTTHPPGRRYHGAPHRSPWRNRDGTT